MDLPPEATCARCGEKLVAVPDHPWRRRDDWTLQFEEALPIRFHGGYGMYDDPDAEFVGRWQDLTLILCGACADGLLDREPWITQVIRRRPQ